MSGPKSSRRTTGKKAAPIPSEIAPGVFVGGWKDAVAFDGARFCVLDEEPEGMPAGLHLPIYDGEKDAPIVANLDTVAERMHAARAKGANVLVYCGHGVRRSPMAAAWYLHRFESRSIEAAYAAVRSVRPQIEEAREWMKNWQALATAPPTSRSRGVR